MPARQPRPMKDVDRTGESPLVEPPTATEWRIVMTEPRREKMAVEEIRRAGYDAWYPQETKWLSRPAKRERAKVNQPLFPRYVFVALRDHAKRPIKDCKHVTALLPYRPPAALIANLFERQEGREFDAAKRQAELEEAKRKAIIGQTVSIISGPFATLNGIVERAEHERVELLVSVFGRPTPIALAYSDIAA